MSKKQDLIDPRVSYWINCYNCANCQLSNNPSVKSDVCGIDKHEIEYTEEEICSIFISDWLDYPNVICENTKVEKL